MKKKSTNKMPFHYCELGERNDVLFQRELEVFALVHTKTTINISIVRL